jgi:PadR family transcriptional regulator, regulatory protein PadR
MASIGDFEKLVLLAILQLGEEAYGASVLDELERRTGRAVSDGAVYVALRRLEEKGLVTSFAGDATAERGGRPRKYLRVEAGGVEALRDARREWDALAQGLDDLLGAES